MESNSHIHIQSKPPAWALHRRLYDWIVSLAHCRHASLALFWLSCAESSFFPLAPDILQIALTLEHNHKAWRYALINTFGSILGGLIGYAIGAFIWHHTSDFFYAYIFSKETFDGVGALYNKWDFWAVFVAAFTPIPYKAITIAAGVFNISLPMFILASFIGRAGRFFAVAALLRYFGPSIKHFVDKYFNLVSLALAALFGLGFLLLSYL